MLKTFTLLVVALCISFTAYSQLVITAVYDADLPGGLPKGIELYALEDIPDLSIYGLGSANNGDGSDGEELTLSGSATEGQFLYASSDSNSFRNFFGFDSDFQGDAMLINGDDAVELFMNGEVIDIFGEIDVDGSGTAWEYTDGWAARKSGTGPDGSTFAVGNWNFSGPGGLDGETTNNTAASPVPIGDYTEEGGGGDPDATVLAENLAFAPRDITIEIGQTVRWTNPETNVAHNVNGSQDAFPCNPVSFFSGVAENGVWEFDFTFNQAGFYEYQCDPHISSDMFGSVTVVDPDAPDAPAYDIALVTTVDEQGVVDSAGTFCTLEGVVHGANARPGGLEFTIIDDGGNGIGVFKNSSDCYEVTEGDRVRITGTIGQFNGLTQIGPTENIEVVSTGNSLVERTMVGGPLSEENESGYLTITDLLMAGAPVATGSSGWNVMMTSTENGTEYLVRIDADLFGTLPVEEFGVYGIKGIGSQFDTESPYEDGYQVIPQFPEDIDLFSSLPTLDKAAISIYPNPATNLVMLKGDLAIEFIRVYDTMGRNVPAEFLNGQMSVDNLLDGIYIVEVYTNEGVWTGQLVKQ